MIDEIKENKIIYLIFIYLSSIGFASNNYRSQSFMTFHFVAVAQNICCQALSLTFSAKQRIATKWRIFMAVC